MRLVLPKRGQYSGRLTFDPETEFHTDPQGRRVVTTDGGATWRYANRGDTSHNARYEQHVLTVDGTRDDNAEAQPHHWQVQPGDDHHDDANPGTARLKFSPNERTRVATSHTDSWKQAA